MREKKRLFSSVAQERIAYRLVLSFALMGIIPMLLTIYLVSVIWLPDLVMWARISVILLLSFSATILGFLLSRNIVHTIMQAAAEAEEIADGDFSKRLKIAGDRSEMSQLASSFNRITSQLEQKISDLESSEKKLRHILDNIPDLLYYLDPDGKISSVNEEVTELLGYSKEELLEQPFSKIIHEKDYERYQWMLRERRADESRLTKGIRIRFITKDGNYRSFEINSRGIYDKDNNFIGTEGLARDITAHLELEKEREEFIYMLSHDIRNPISAILFIVYMIRDGTISADKYDEYFDKIEIACNGVVRLVEDFLEYKKLELGNIKIERSKVDLGKMILGISQTYSSKAEAKGKKITVNSQDFENSTLSKKLLVNVDERYFPRILENLITNAINFAQTQVDVGFLENKDSITISVTDDGSGVTENEKENIFRLFHTSSGSRTAKGIGVGLASAFKIVQAHGGRLWVEQTERQGCSFMVNIPNQPTHPTDAEPGEKLQQDGIPTRREG